jgi:hypothetical protein
MKRVVPAIFTNHSVRILSHALAGHPRREEDGVDASVGMAWALRVERGCGRGDQYVGPRRGSFSGPDAAF